jgi:predicted dienelactone hydrolase
MKQLYFPILSALIICFLVIIFWKGHSWHMYPLYVSLLIITLMLSFNKKGKRQFTSYFFILAWAGISFVLHWLFPVFSMPKPSGPYEIGVRYATLETERPETMTPEEGDQRTLYLKIWYPAKTTQGFPKNPYMEGGKNAIDLLMERAGLPAILFYHFPKIKTNSHTRAPLADGSFPLLTFSHGYGSWFGQNTALAEELASRGFIVAGITHSHQSVFTAMDENEIYSFPEIVSLGEEDPDSLLIAEFERSFRLEDTSEFSDIFYQHLENSPATNQYAEIWAEDIRSVLDHLLEQNASDDSSFYGHIDTSRIGSFGMSFGGAASAEAGLKDNRIKAAVNMDGTQYGGWFRDTIHIPVLMMEAMRSDYGYSMYAPLKHRSNADYFSLIFQGAEHYNFTDANYFSPVLKWIKLTGPIKGTIMIKSMNTIVPDFFENVFGEKKFDVKKYSKEAHIVEPTF